MSLGFVLWPLSSIGHSNGFAPADHAPARFRRKVEAQQGVIALGDFKRRIAVAVFLCQARDLVVEDVRQPLQEQQRQQ